EITTVGKSIFSSPIFIVRTDPRVETNIQECSWRGYVEINSGLIKECTFNKKHSTTSLLVSVKTSARIHEDPCSLCCARYYVTFNGHECSPVPIDQAITLNDSKDNWDWIPFTIRGICKLNHYSGNIKVGLNVGQCGSKASVDPDTGNGDFVTSSIIIEEVENVKLYIL
uniref:CTHRC1 C-terminal domain-containing protein n=1 Tax=Clytia hemisphaerica TaxID=252671 RepID=A0A7M5XEJ2_9CNID